MSTAIFNLDSRWREEVDFTLVGLASGDLGGSQNWSGRCEQEEIVFPLSRIQPRFLNFPV